MKKIYLKRMPDPINFKCDKCYFRNKLPAPYICGRPEKFIYNKNNKSCSDGHYYFKKIKEEIC